MRFEEERMKPIGMSDAFYGNANCKLTGSDGFSKTENFHRRVNLIFFFFKGKKSYYYFYFNIKLKGYNKFCCKIDISRDKSCFIVRNVLFYYNLYNF